MNKPQITIKEGPRFKGGESWRSVLKGVCRTIMIEGLTMWPKTRAFFSHEGQKKGKAVSYDHSTGR